MKRTGDSGISLLNVLVVVAAGAGLVQVMLTDQTIAIDQLQDAADVSQTRALAQAGVSSVAVALRRDLQVAPESDHFREPWAANLQETIDLGFGEFSVTAEDLRGRFDLNALGPGKIIEMRVFTALLKQLDLPETLASEIATAVSQNGSLDAPEELRGLGFSASDLQLLRPHVTALPVRHPLNLNAVTEPLLAALLSNPVAADSLISRRAAAGFLDRNDFTSLGLLVPPLAGFASDAFSVTGSAETGNARSRLTRQVLRDRRTGQITLRWSE